MGQSISKIGGNTLADIKFREQVKKLDSKVDLFDSQIKDKASKQEVDVERKRIDSFISLAEGSTTGDAELLDGRIGIDGNTYSNIGEAIRSQVGNVNEKVICMEDELGMLIYNQYRRNGYLLNDGTFSTPATYHCIYTSRISCKPGDIFEYTGHGVNMAMSYIIYSGSSIIETGQIDGTDTVTIPVGATSVMFSSFANASKEIVFNLKKLYPESIVDTVKNMTPNLLNKKISLEGDSICYGAGYLGGYGKIIAEKYNMTLVNNAIAGGTIAVVPDKHCICKGVELLPSDSDYIILEGGGNDASVGNKVPIGSLSDGFNAELDKTTYYGAFEYMLKQLTTRFHGKKYGYIACHTWAKKYSSFYNGSDNYYIASKKCCEKWGVPFLDLNVQVPPFNQLRDNDTYDTIRNLYTKNGDGTHPTLEGYKKYYVPKIEAWLNSL